MGAFAASCAPPDRSILVQRAHGLRDRRRELEQVLRNVGVRLEGVEASRERFPGGARERDGVGHGFVISYGNRTVAEPRTQWEKASSSRDVRPSAYLPAFRQV